MQMASYLDEIEHAVTSSLSVLWSDSATLDEQRKRTAVLAVRTEDGYRRADFFAMNPDLDDEGLGTFIHFDTYFGADKERFHSEAEERQIAERIATLEFSNGAMAGAVLQFAKQALSIVHGGRDAAPDGRLIGTQPLKNVIWQARNQAMHWDEGRLSATVVGCFDALAADFDAVFLDYHRRSLAFEVIQRLDWRNFGAFRADLENLA